MPGRKWPTTSLRARRRSALEGAPRRRIRPSDQCGGWGCTEAAAATIDARQHVDPLAHFAVRVGDEMVRAVRRDDLKHVGDAHLSEAGAARRGHCRGGESGSARCYARRIGTRHPDGCDLGAHGRDSVHVLHVDESHRLLIEFLMRSRRRDNDGVEPSAAASSAPVEPARPIGDVRVRLYSRAGSP